MIAGLLGTVHRATIASEEPEVLAALQALGYSSTEAITAISELPDDGDKAVEARVLAALQKLGSSST